MLFAFFAAPMRRWLRPMLSALVGALVLVSGNSTQASAAPETFSAARPVAGLYGAALGLLLVRR